MRRNKSTKNEDDEDVDYRLREVSDLEDFTRVQFEKLYRKNLGVPVSIYHL